MAVPVGLDNPILSSPYDAPGTHFGLGPVFEA